MRTEHAIDCDMGRDCLCGAGRMSLVGFKANNHRQQVAKRGALDTIDDRATPEALFNEYERRFDFTLDAAASDENTKCIRWHTIKTNGLERKWTGERVWCNPPYSDLASWVAKAWRETEAAPVIVMLVPANRTKQAWWQDFVEPHRDRPGSRLRVEFRRGRDRFIRAGATSIGPNERPPFGCAALIWRAP